VGRTISASKQSAAERDAARAARGPGRAIARLARQVEHGLSPIGLSLQQYRALALLAEGPAAATRLAERLTVSPPSVTAVVDGLVARELVTRAPDPDDRRRQHLALTPAGLALLLEADAAVTARLSEVAAHFGEDEARERVGGLKDWHPALDAHRERQRPNP
jgi:long-chain acyl-CoA synthetase